MATPSWWHRAKGWPGWILLAVAVIALLAIGTTRNSGPRTSDDRIADISKRLACPICDGESVFESRNAASVAIKTQITEDVQAGTLSDDQIITKIAQLFGGKVLIVPSGSGIDALVWALPVTAAVCAVGGLFLVFRRWRLQTSAAPSDEDRALVEAALHAEHLDGPAGEGES